MFYLADGIRERIIEKEGQFYVNDTSIEFSRDEILVEFSENIDDTSVTVNGDAAQFTFGGTAATGIDATTVSGSGNA